MNQWNKNIASWNIGKNLYLSVPFTWLLPNAQEMAKKHKGPVFAGGPAVDLMPYTMSGVADIETPCPIPAIQMHNPLATFTSRGCINNCPFCAVPRIEGELRELDMWPVRPIICDNNLLACSIKHFDEVIDKLKRFPYVDFNQGLDARKFNRYHASRIAELKGAKVRFAFDTLSMETTVHDAIALAHQEGLKNIGVYVLIGFRDSPDGARYRLEKVRGWGALPNPMRYQPLNELEKNSFVAENWTERELRRMMKYYSRLNWLEHIPYEHFRKDRQKKMFA